MDVDYERFQLGELPKKLRNEVTKTVSDFTVGFHLDGLPAGSGVLVKYKETFGILTAHHVPFNPEERSRCFKFNNLDQKLGIILKGASHDFDIPMGTIQPVEIGIPSKGNLKDGPDLCLLVLTELDANRIKNYRVFYNLGLNTENRLKDSLSELGIYVLAGYPNAMKQVYPRDNFFKEIVRNIGISAISLRKRYYKRNGFDYLEIGYQWKGSIKLPIKVNGASGGGIWHFGLTRKKRRR